MLTSGYRLDADEHHIVNFLWNSPQNGLLRINKLIWNGYGDPIRLIGFSINPQGVSPLYLEVVAHTPNWSSLSYRLEDYQQYYTESAIKEHVYGELCDYMSMYLP